jgi:hypothetical protein
VSRPAISLLRVRRTAVRNYGARHSSVGGWPDHLDPVLRHPAGELLGVSLAQLRRCLAGNRGNRDLAEETVHSESRRPRVPAGENVISVSARSEVTRNVRCCFTNRQRLARVRGYISLGTRGHYR